MSRWYGDKECPRDPHDAYREGRYEARSWDRNPYEHGRYGEYDCQRAFEEWNRGHRAKEDERREEERQQEAAEERAARERAEQAKYEREQYEHAYYEQMEQALQEEESHDAAPSPDEESKR